MITSTTNLISNNQNNQNNLRLERGNNHGRHHSKPRRKAVFDVHYSKPHRYYEKKWYRLENKKPPDLTKRQNMKIKIAANNSNPQLHRPVQGQLFHNKISQNQIPQNQPGLKLKYLTPVERECLYDLLNQYKKILQEENNRSFCRIHQHKINALNTPICETAEARQKAQRLRFEALSISDAKKIQEHETSLKCLSEKSKCFSNRSKKSQKTVISHIQSQISAVRSQKSNNISQKSLQPSLESQIQRQKSQNLNSNKNSHVLHNLTAATPETSIQVEKPVPKVADDLVQSQSTNINSNLSLNPTANSHKQVTVTFGWSNNSRFF